METLKKDLGLGAQDWKLGALATSFNRIHAFSEADLKDPEICAWILRLLGESPHQQLLDPSTYQQSQQNFAERLRKRSEEKEFIELERMIEAVCAARPFFLFPDSYSQRDINDMKRFVTDDGEFAQIQELFHPDMNVPDIRVAISALQGVFAAADQIQPGNTEAFRELKRTAANCSRALWEHRPTQLETDEAKALWQLLDDIDTLSDQIKPASHGGFAIFYERVLDIAKKRHLYLKSDGYKLEWPPQPISAEQPNPIPMILHCPMCHTRHIDEGEFATRAHHTHACQGYLPHDSRRRRCGNVWRPALVPTVGVEALPGFINEPVSR